MVRIIDGRSLGKTRTLLQLAKDNNCIVACKTPSHMKRKAEDYGILGVDFIPYTDVNNYIYSKDIYIDEIEEFVRTCCTKQLRGYTLTNED